MIASGSLRTLNAARIGTLLLQRERQLAQPRPRRTYHLHRVHGVGVVGPQGPPRRNAARRRHFGIVAKPGKARFRKALLMFLLCPVLQPGRNRGPSSPRTAESGGQKQRYISILVP